MCFDMAQSRLGYSPEFVVQDLTKHIFKALAHTGQRAIIGKGWAGLGKIKDEPTPPHVLLVDSVPHDWLFPRCSAVIHHGGHGHPSTVGCLPLGFLLGRV